MVNEVSSSLTNIFANDSELLRRLLILAGFNVPGTPINGLPGGRVNEFIQVEGTKTKVLFP